VRVLVADFTDLVQDAERSKHPQRVRGLVDTDAMDSCLRPHLHDIDGRSTLCESRRGTEAADPATHHQHSGHLHGRHLVRHQKLI
jgi:hypothetical protein